MDAALKSQCEPALTRLVKLLSPFEGLPQREILKRERLKLWAVSPVVFWTAGDTSSTFAFSASRSAKNMRASTLFLKVLLP